MTMQPYLTTKCNVSAQVFAQDYIAAVFTRKYLLSWKWSENFKCYVLAPSSGGYTKHHCIY